MKQRLIDANEFAIEEPKLWDWSSIDGISSTAVLKQCIWDVQCAPVVDAIPIEWLKKFANERALNDGMDGYWHFWGADLLQMIEQWENENEAN